MNYLVLDIMKVTFYIHSLALDVTLWLTSLTTGIHWKPLHISNEITKGFRWLRRNKIIQNFVFTSSLL